VETSVLIGRLFAALYIAVGVGMLVRPAHYKKMIADFSESPALLYLGGAMALAAGVLIVTFHNDWTPGWTIILTLLGWAALVKGFLILALPDLIIHTMGGIYQRQAFLSVVGGFALVLGLALGYFSFLA